VERYNWHMGYVDNSDCRPNSYSMSPRTFKWTTKLLFHLLDFRILYSWILSFSCGAEHTHRDFRLLLVRNLIEEAGKSQDCHTPRSVGRTSAGVKNVLRLKSHHNTGQQNSQPNCAAICVLLAAKERGQCTRAPDVTWACAWCLGSRNITQNNFVNHPLCEYSVSR